MSTLSQALTSTGHIHTVRHTHQTKIISGRPQRAKGPFYHSHPIIPFRPICICLCCWFPSIPPPLPEHGVLPFQQTQRPHCSCFGWFVLNLSRHRMTSQHCIDSSTLRSASLPRPPTHACGVTLPLTVVVEEHWKPATNGATVQMQLEATQSLQKLLQFTRTDLALNSLIFTAVLHRWLRDYMAKQRNPSHISQSATKYTK